MLIATPDRQIHHVRNSLEKHIIGRFGVPKVMWSDNAAEFISKPMTQFFESYGIRHKKVSLYHAQGNFVERQNRNVNFQLKLLIANHKTDWDSYLPQMEMALNSVANCTTVFSPFELVFGQKPRLPNDFQWLEDDTLPIGEILKGRSSRILEQNHVAKDIFRLAQTIALDAQDTQAKYFNMSHRPVSYKVGDIVKVTNFVLSNKSKLIQRKTEATFKGPFIIIKKTGDNYTLAYNNEDKKVFGTYNVKNVKPYYADSDSESDIDEFEKHNADEDDIWDNILVDPSDEVTIKNKQYRADNPDSEIIIQDEIAVKELDEYNKNKQNKLTGKSQPQEQNKNANKTNTKVSIPQDSQSIMKQLNIDQNKNMTQNELTKIIKNHKKNNSNDLLYRDLGHADQPISERTRNKKKVPINSIKVSINNVLQYPKQNLFVKNDNFWDCEMCAEHLYKYIDKPKNNNILISFHCEDCSELFHQVVFKNTGLHGDEQYGISCSEKSPCWKNIINLAVIYYYNENLAKDTYNLFTTITIKEEEAKKVEITYPSFEWPIQEFPKHIKFLDSNKNK